MPKTSPTQRTLQWLRSNGYRAGVVERWNPHAGRFGIRQDFLGFLDVLAVRGDVPGVLGVQATSGSGGNLTSRQKKILTPDVLANATEWLSAGNRVLFIAWRQLVARRKDGSKSAVKRWTPLLREAVLADGSVRFVDRDAAVLGVHTGRKRE